MARQEDKRNIKIKNRGYTLIEIMIVLMITSIVFVSIYALFAKSMKYDTEGRYEIIASELAQEGVEMIKNKKEKNEMDWAVWNPQSSGVSADDIDDDTSGLTTFKNIDSLPGCNPGLTWDSDGSNYSFDCVNNTKIKYNKVAKKYVSGCSGVNCAGMELDRKCSTNELNLDGSKALRVACVVTWNSPLLNGGERKVKATLVLTDWER